MTAQNFRICHGIYSKAISLTYATVYCCHQVANDGPGKGLLAELEADGVDTSYIAVSWICSLFFVHLLKNGLLYMFNCYHLFVFKLFIMMMVSIYFGRLLRSPSLMPSLA